MQEEKMHLLNQRMCLLGKINNEASYLLSIGFGKLIYKYCLKRDSICYMPLILFFSAILRDQT